jgi:hypothetical protein
MERRHVLAVSIRGGLGEPQLARVVRTAALAEELNALADELDDDRLALDSASAVARDRLVSGAAESALAPALPPGRVVLAHSADPLRLRAPNARGTRRSRSGHARAAFGARLIHHAAGATGVQRSR